MLMGANLFSKGLKKGAQAAAFISKIVFIISWRAIALALLGLVINFTLYVFSDTALLYLTGSVYVGFLWRLLGYVFIFLFFFLYPVFYIWVSWSWGIAHAVHYIFTKSMEGFVRYFVDKFVDFVFNNKAIKEKVEHGLTRSLLFETLPNYLEKLPNVPRLLRPVVHIVIRKLNLQEVFTLAVQKNEDQIDKEGISSKLTEQIMNKLPSVVKTPSLVPFFLVLGANLALFIIIQLMVM
jgi:hypothetical protein